jgi:hypothetical protein
MMGLPPWLTSDQTAGEHAVELGAYLAWAATKESQPNREITCAGKAAAVAAIHLKIGVAVDHLHPHVREVRRGIKREQGDMGLNVKRTRRALTPAIISAGLGCKDLWLEEEGQYLAWYLIALCYGYMLRAEEVWAVDKGDSRAAPGEVRRGRGLLREDMEFRAASRTLPPERWEEATHVVLHLKSHKGDQWGEGSMVARGGTVAALAKQLYGLHVSLPPKAPLCSYVVPGGGYRTIKASRGTAVLREMLGELKEAGTLEGEPAEYALHSGRIGGASALQDGGASGAQIQEAGRWHSTAYLVYMRSNKDDDELSSMIWPASVPLPAAACPLACARAP